MRRSRKGSLFAHVPVMAMNTVPLAAGSPGKWAHVYGTVSDDGFNMMWVRRATYLAVSSCHCCWKCWGVGSVELRNPQAVLGCLGSGRSNVACSVPQSCWHDPTGGKPCVWVAKRSGFIWSDRWPEVFAANGGIQANRAVDLTGD